MWHERVGFCSKCEELTTECSGYHRDDDRPDSIGEKPNDRVWSRWVAPKSLEYVIASLLDEPVYKTRQHGELADYVPRTYYHEERRHTKTNGGVHQRHSTRLW